MKTKIKLPSEENRIEPQPGMQHAFLASRADIVLGGGVAGAGKSFALLMEPLRHIDNPQFSAVIFRRTYPQITNEGGLWDTSASLYTLLGAVPKTSSMKWVFPSGSTIRFCHMQYEDDRFSWDGAQIPLLMFDQVEHFEGKQFWYMFSRNRSMTGIRPYIRMTANPPHPDHWLRALVDWWIDPETGLPIEDRSGVVRWFTRIGEEVFWAGSRAELISEYGAGVEPKSFTFIRGNLNENQALLDKSPEYRANLLALPLVDRERLLLGNWNVRETAGAFFQRDWFPIVDAAPAMVRQVRYWDRAASVNGYAGSWTAGVKLGISYDGQFYVLDVARFRAEGPEVRRRIRNLAEQEGTIVEIGIEQDPAQAGKVEASDQVRNLAGFNVYLNTVRESKGLRARPFSAQAEAGNVILVRGVWNRPYLDELSNFDGTDKCTSDQVDASSGAFTRLTGVEAGTWGRR